MSSEVSVLAVAEHRKVVSGWRPIDSMGRLPDIGFAFLSVLMSARYLMNGVGYVLDDWFALANTHFDGNWSAPGARAPNAGDGGSRRRRVARSGFSLGQSTVVV